MSSCAAPMRELSIPPCSGEGGVPFTPYGDGRQGSIVGRVKIVLAKYRVRGICKIWSEASGRILIDFEHSSLFGAYREDAAIMLDGGELIIIDRERGRMYDNDESLSMLGSELAFELFPDDIAYVLLLAVPDCDAIEGLDLESDDGRWHLSGVWRGRDIEMEGRSGRGPDRLTLCSNNRTECYTIKYKYSGNWTYPKGLEMAREGGEERIYLEVIDSEFRSIAGEAE
jgi:hypothetical protein